MPMPFASVLRDGLIEAINHGDGEKDLAALAEVSARRSGGVNLALTRRAWPEGARIAPLRLNPGSAYATSATAGEIRLRARVS